MASDFDNAQDYWNAQAAFEAEKSKNQCNMLYSSIGFFKMKRFIKLNILLAHANVFRP